jgi:hypothetical protein
MRNYSLYKSMLLETLDDIKKSIADNDKQHLAILLDRMEKQIINRV